VAAEGRAAVEVPGELVELLAGRPVPGAEEQAFVLLTVDEAGWVHICLLSRAELEADAHQIRAVIASRRARRHLARDGRATLLAVGGGVAHVCRLRLERQVEGEGAVAAAFSVVDHARDDAGVALQPLRYRATAELAEREHWARSAELNRRLSEAEPPGR
jgi:hypothetical protein